ncbi:hypothetical protein [Idiomarina abyssalis]|uniref:hypothetical protein n=1 Tax=Idiomarina abyssalis TaxID=86102 RepID=UPI001C95953D|nr:hypothetical protein [Idiomarina abyssalis]QZN91797.1 hypothetical protein K5X84_04655 [Idiomarina abyssalis]
MKVALFCEGKFFDVVKMNELPSFSQELIHKGSVYKVIFIHKVGSKSSEVDTLIILRQLSDFLVA